MMYPFKEVQSSASTLFQAYASWAASVILIRSMANELIPTPVRSYIQSAINYLFTPLSNQITIVIDEQSGMSRNQVYDSAEIYLSKKISPSTERFKVNKTPKQKTINVTMEKNQEITDRFRDIQLKWRFVFVESQQDRGYSPEKRFFELSFNKKHKDAVLNDYLPFVLERAKQIRDNERVVKLYTRDCPYTDDDYNGGCGGGNWGAINLDHPATFDTLAMDPDAKRAIIEDLDRFVRRREYYKKVGKAWKRGYLLYGPTGTGKSTLVAAMANYLKFDIYDLELTSLYSNSELRRILVSTTNRSIIVIEDIDCSVEMHDRQLGHDSENDNSNKLTLSGLLNFIDGLWSSCGDERIVVFTTNYKEKLDPALLRPGRMDMHIHMSYCTPQGFKILALNYHGIREHSRLGEIESLIENVEVTPAEVAEELMRSEAAGAALEGVVNFLRRKRPERNEVKDEKRPEAQKEDRGPTETDIQEAKTLKITEPSEVTDEKCPTPEEKEDASPTAADIQETKRLKTEEILRRTLRSVGPLAKRRYKRRGRSRV